MQRQLEQTWQSRTPRGSLSPAEAPAGDPALVDGQMKRRDSKVKMVKSLRKVKSKVAIQQHAATKPATMDIRQLKALQPKDVRGVVESDPATKAAWIAGRWMPFVKRCNALRDIARERAQSNLNIWYGRGKANLSFMYEWFISRNEKEAEAGEWNQQQGKSAIDNTLLNNMFTPAEATLLLAGEVCHRFTVVMLCFRQERALRIIGERINMPLQDEEDPDVIKAVLEKMEPHALRKWGIEPDNVSYRSLALTGKLVWNWGQIPAEFRVRMQKYFREDLLTRTKELPPDDTFAKFVAHAKSRPGEYIEMEARPRASRAGQRCSLCATDSTPDACYGARLHHVVTLFAGAIAGKLIVITRSEMEKHTKAKYLAVQWRRKCDLKNTEGKVLRPAGTIEHLRLRINEAGYTYAHGMS
eukprot:gene37240-6763_t